MTLRGAPATTILMIVAGLVNGCGPAKRPNELPVYPVKGRFTFKGEPMGSAIITFYPTGKAFADAMKCRATTDADGNFELTTYEHNDGAPVGDYDVVLYWPVTPTKPGELEAPNQPDRLKHTYIDVKNPKLKASVKAEPNRIDFDLK